MNSQLTVLEYTVYDELYNSTSDQTSLTQNVRFSLVLSNEQQGPPRIRARSAGQGLRGLWERD